MENEINIFDKKSGNLKMTVWDKRLPYSSSGYTILDFDGSSLWLIGWKIEVNDNKGNYLVNIKL